MLDGRQRWLSSHEVSAFEGYKYVFSGCAYEGDLFRGFMPAMDTSGQIKNGQTSWDGSK